MTHVMTIKMKDGGEIEVHALNPGQHFPLFGGSSRGLTVGKTASIITRTKTVGTSDFERDIHEEKFWTWIAERINDETGATKAIIPDRA